MQGNVCVGGYACVYMCVSEQDKEGSRLTHVICVPAQLTHEGKGQGVYDAAPKGELSVVLARF